MYRLRAVAAGLGMVAMYHLSVLVPFANALAAGKKPIDICSIFYSGKNPDDKPRPHDGALACHAAMRPKKVVVDDEDDDFSL